MINFAGPLMNVDYMCFICKVFNNLMTKVVYSIWQKRARSVQR